VIKNKEGEGSRYKRDKRIKRIEGVVENVPGIPCGIDSAFGLTLRATLRVVVSLRDART
jgi:hypothetical protein